MKSPHHHPADPGTARTEVATPAAPVAPGPFQPPPTIGPFALQRLLGRGGMAAVYLATERGTGRTVAVKLMDPNLKGDRTFIERFLNEARASAALHHPNVVETLSHGEHEGWYFIATEYVDGGTVAQLLATMGRLPVTVATELFAQLMAGLAYAHSTGIVHRDLKPENLLLTSTGTLKVGDFGIARTLDHQKLTKTGMLVGTAGYMSPEQARGETVDHQSDLFASGIILFEMLTGQNPFGGDSPAASLTRILSSQPPSLFETIPWVPAELDQLADRLLAPVAADRPRSAHHVFEMLQSRLAGHRAEHPTLVAECLKRPAEMRRTLESEAATALVNEAMALLTSGQLEKNRAVFKLHFARLLDPSNAHATAQLERVSQVLGLRFGPPTNGRIRELEQTLAQAPGAPGVLQQLAQLYKLEGNLPQSARYLKKYLKVKPGDAYAANQLFHLTGERVGSAVQVGEATRELMAGVKTGGFKAAARPVAARPAVPSINLPGQLTVTDVESRSPWAAPAGRAAVVLALVAVVALGGRALLRAIDHATEDTARASAELRQGMQAVAAGRPVVAPEANPPAADGPEAALADALAAQAGADVEQALAAFEAVAHRWPDTPQAARALLERGRCLLTLRRNSEAREAFSAFLHQRPDHPLASEALLRHAQACAQNLADDDALADLDEFLAKNAGHRLAGEALLWRGEVKARRHDTEAARADFTQAKATLRPDDPLQERVARGLEQP